MENGELKIENERDVSPVSAHGFNNEKPPCESRVVAVCQKSIILIFTLRAAARIK